MRTPAVLFIVLLLVGCGSQPAPKAEHVPVPDTTTPALVLAHEVQSNVTSGCLPCHAAGGSAARHDLTSPEETAKLVVPGKADSSRLYQVLASGKMPPTGRLDSAKLATFRKWIDEGTKDN